MHSFFVYMKTIVGDIHLLFWHKPRLKGCIALNGSNSNVGFLVGCNKMFQDTYGENLFSGT